MICKYCLQNYVFIRNHVIFGKLLYISRRISCLCEKTILMYLYLFCKGINKLFTKLSRRWVRPFPLSVRLLTSRHLEMSTWSKRKGKINVNFTVEWLNNWAICFPLFTSLSLSLSLKGKISCYVFVFFCARRLYQSQRLIQPASFPFLTLHVLSTNWVQAPLLNYEKSL